MMTPLSIAVTSLVTRTSPVSVSTVTSANCGAAGEKWEATTMIRRWLK